MLATPVIVAVSLAYLALLFAVAYYARRRSDAGRSIVAHPSVYALSLGVYATSWTFYGSVGRAADTGVGFLPVYLGPTLMFALGWLVLRKIIRISKENRITSIADFIASRYGKSTLVGGLVTIIAVLGIVPYISLQLKAVSDTVSILTEYPRISSPTDIGAVSVLEDKALYVALVLAAFTIVFGTRKLDASERHEGMVAASRLRVGRQAGRLPRRRALRDVRDVRRLRRHLRAGGEAARGGVAVHARAGPSTARSCG